MSIRYSLKDNITYLTYGVVNDNALRDGLVGPVFGAQHHLCMHVIRRGGLPGRRHSGLFIIIVVVAAGHRCLVNDSKGDVADALKLPVLDVPITFKMISRDPKPIQIVQNQNI